MTCFVIRRQAEKRRGMTPHHERALCAVPWATIFSRCSACVILNPAVSTDSVSGNALIRPAASEHWRERIFVFLLMLWEKTLRRAEEAKSVLIHVHGNPTNDDFHATGTGEGVV